jgi:hypothetical protein
VLLWLEPHHWHLSEQLLGTALSCAATHTANSRSKEEPVSGSCKLLLSEHAYS